MRSSLLLVRGAVNIHRRCPTHGLFTSHGYQFAFSSTVSPAMAALPSTIAAAAAEIANNGTTLVQQRRSFSPTRAVPDGAALTAFDVFNLSAYPPYTAEAEAYLLKHLNIADPVSEALDLFLYAWRTSTDSKVKGAKWEPNSKTMALNFSFVLQHKPRDDAAKAAVILRERLNNIRDRSDMALADCDAAFGELKSFLQEYSAVADPKKDAANRDKRLTGLLTLFSTRGSGKTQLLKKALFAAPAALAEGYVLVCACSRSSLLFSEALGTLLKSKCDEEAIGSFLVSIIQKHVHSALGKQLTCGGDSPMAAVASAVGAWKEACRRPGTFQPLIVFDTTEALPHMSTVPCTKRMDRRFRTVIEVMVSLLPKGHGMVAVGCLHVGTADVDDPTLATVTRIATLPPLSLGGYLKSLGPWTAGWDPVVGGTVVHVRYPLPTEVTTTMRLLHALCGGVPRLLRQSVDPHDVRSCQYLEKWESVLNTFVNHCVDSAKLSEYEDNVIDVKKVGRRERAANRNAVLAMAALYGGVRGVVRPEDAVPFAPLSTWSLAQKGILFTNSNGEAMVPPALLLKGDLCSVSAALANARSLTEADGTAILRSGSGLFFPKELVESWPNGLDLQCMHCPMSLGDLQSLAVSNLNRTATGKSWEEQAAHCIVGRWYMLHLNSGRKTYRFSLKSVLNADASAASTMEGVTPLDLSEITVDFSRGLVRHDCDSHAPMEKSFCFNSNSKGHHDVKFGAWRGAEPIVVCVQMRHGLEESEKELRPQLRVRRNSTVLVDALLLIGSGPSSGAFRDLALLQRAVRVDGSRFANHSVLDLLEPCC